MIVMEKVQMEKAIQQACLRIAPYWTLKNFVAVNPYLGFTSESFKETAQKMAQRSNVQLCMDVNFYLDQFEDKNILLSDIEKAIHKSDTELTTNEFLHFTKELALKKTSEQGKIKTIIDLAQDISEKDWNQFMIDRISSWASSYFNEFNASNNEPFDGEQLFQSWKKEAEADRSTQIMGLSQFRIKLEALPNDPQQCATYILHHLQISEDIAETYLHSLLLKTLGWSSFIRGIDWNNNLYQGNQNNLSTFLTIVLCWEYCLMQEFQPRGIEYKWERNLKAIANQVQNLDSDEMLNTKLIWQDAYDTAHERQLKNTFNRTSGAKIKKLKPQVQQVFCIDVRSEVIRRHIEAVNPQIDTIGFAGFFGVPINYIPLAHEEGKNQCPVLIPSAVTVKESLKDNQLTEKAVAKRKIRHQFRNSITLFKKNPVSSFGYVSPLGLSFLPKLLSDTFGWTRPIVDPNLDGLDKWIKDQRDVDLSAIDLKSQIDMGTSILTAMGIKSEIAPLVVITGHGSSSTNNPHATGYDCGACGGHSGEINSLTAAKILNNPQVRLGIEKNDIKIPANTFFVAALHDTTTDQIHILNQGDVPPQHLENISELKNTFEQAGTGCRRERALRMNVSQNDIDQDIFKRAKDWSQVRHEWGLAGCDSFIIAPRHRTAEANLKGQSFLHSYDWKSDTNFQILETIITAPMVVTSWINLQYYASTVDNQHFGSGNKTLHNVTGGLGVLEGSSGDLRIGLPFQSIHDGTKLQHLPKRLKVIIEAPIEAINQILDRHESVRDLVDNEWIVLMQLNEEGQLAKRYTRNLNWENISDKQHQTENKELFTL